MHSSFFMYKLSMEAFIYHMTLVSGIYQRLSPFRQHNTSSSKVQITVLASQRNVPSPRRRGEGLVCGGVLATSCPAIILWLVGNIMLNGGQRLSSLMIVFTLCSW